MIAINISCVVDLPEESLRTRGRGRIIVPPEIIVPDNLPNSDRLYSKKVAVIIGIDEYPNLSKKFQLKYAVRDARGVSTVLKKKFGFKQIISLYNKDATKDNILKVLQGNLSKEGCANIDSQSAVLIYFAGHGHTEKTHQGELGYLIPYNGSMNGNEMDKNISMQLLKSDVCPIIVAKHVLFVIDACFGGLLLNHNSATEYPDNTMHYIKKCTKYQVRQILTAGGKKELVIDSLFTGHLINILEKVDHYITALGLGHQVMNKVKNTTKLLQINQEPVIGKIYGKGDFVFIAQSDNALDKPNVNNNNGSIVKYPREENMLIQLEKVLKKIQTQNDELLKVDSKYAKKRLKEYQLLNEECQKRISELENISPRNYSVETIKNYKKRRKEQLAIARQLKQECSEKLGNIDPKYQDVIDSEKETYAKQKQKISKQLFVIEPSDGLIFVLDKYLPQTEEFIIKIKFNQWLGYISGRLPVAPTQAELYQNKPHLLKPIVILSLDSDGIVYPISAEFYYQKYYYPAQNLKANNIVPTTIIPGPLPGMKFLYVPPGEFFMGSNPSEAERSDNENLHAYKISDGFYIQTTEVTQEQWIKIMGNHPSTAYSANYPVSNVSWYDVQQFIEKLNQKDVTKRYRLPTEAEWEYACRSGVDTAYSWGDDVSCANMMHNNYQNHHDTSLCIDYIRNKKWPIGSPAPVKSYLPNSWGLYDMHGNVWEWCSDAYENNNNFRVVKGGSWASEAKDCRSATRKRLEPDEKRSVVGFRLLMQH